jgi:hypothetical protein
MGAPGRAGSQRALHWRRLAGARAQLAAAWGRAGWAGCGPALPPPPSTHGRAQLPACPAQRRPPVILAWSAMIASTVLCMGQGMPAVQEMVATTCAATIAGSARRRLSHAAATPVGRACSSCPPPSRSRSRSRSTPRLHMPRCRPTAARLEAGQRGRLGGLLLTLQAPLSACSALNVAPVTNLELPGNCRAFGVAGGRR